MQSDITPMYAAAQNDHKDVVECLAEHGADVNAPNDVCSLPVVLFVCCAQLNHLSSPRVLRDTHYVGGTE